MFERMFEYVKRIPRVVLALVFDHSAVSVARVSLRHMCGRFVVASSTEELVDLFDVDDVGEDLPGPSYNVRPTDPVPVVLESAKNGPVVRRLEAARWSLVPSFSKQLKTSYPMFNARSEEVATKASFRSSLVSKRALIPAAGYYEWHTVGTTKTPYYIHPSSGVIAFAGLYSWWRNPELADDDPDRWVLTATILTRPAVGELAGIHPRTPLVLPAAMWDQWLDPARVGDQDLVDEAVDAAVPETEELEFYRVGPVKGDNTPALIAPVEE
jgi:putative SOS response-associated peptidase YedK